MTNADLAYALANGEDVWASKYDPQAGSGALIRAAQDRIAGHGYVDDGYADSDDTSRAIAALERLYL